MADADLLQRIGLHEGEPTRFRRGRSSWVAARISGVTADGRITVRGVPPGVARSIRPHDLEVRRPGVRGRLTWQNVVTVAITWEQLSLW